MRTLALISTPTFEKKQLTYLKSKLKAGSADDGSINTSYIVRSSSLGEWATISPSKNGLENEINESLLTQRRIVVK